MRTNCEMTGSLNLEMPLKTKTTQFFFQKINTCVVYNEIMIAILIYVVYNEFAVYDVFYERASIHETVDRDLPCRAVHDKFEFPWFTLVTPQFSILRPYRDSECTTGHNPTDLSRR